MILADQLALAVAACVTLGAGWRVAGALGADGPTRGVATAVIAAAFACATTMLLGRIGLSASPVALTAVAVAGWLAVVRWVPAPRERGAERLPPSTRTAALVGAGLGGVIAFAAWALHSPGLVGDGLSYHAPMVGAWTEAGDAPAVHAISTDAPLEAYPLTTELLVSWATGISHGFGPMAVWNSLMLALVGFATWAVVRTLGATRRAAALGVVALSMSPLLVSQLNTFTTDLPALAWLMCTAALSAAAVRTPRLIPLAIVAGGLAVGTKTTAAPLVVICLGAAIYIARARLREQRVAIGLAGLVAVAVGGYWFIRNSVAYGSPLWPFVSTPWGDELPPAAELGAERLLFDLGATAGRFDDYARNLWGNIALLAALIPLPLVARSRAAVATGCIALLAVAIWSVAPYTAYPDGPIFDGLQGGTTRYLIPAIAAAAVAVALAASEKGPSGIVYTVVLVVGAVASFVGVARLGLLSDFQARAAFEVDPHLPGISWVLAGAALGALGALLFRALSGSPSVAGRRTAAATVVLAAAVALAIGTSGYASRWAAQETSPAPFGDLIRTPGYPEGATQVAMESRLIAPLAGDRFTHRLVLIRPGTTCAELDRLLAEGWVVLSPSTGAVPEGDSEYAIYAREQRAAEERTAACLAGVPPAFESDAARIYSPVG